MCAIVFKICSMVGYAEGKGAQHEEVCYSMKDTKYQWFGRGDISAFFALMPDNMATLAIMAALLKMFGVPNAVVFGMMIPGTALGVMVGDLIYTWLAFRLSKRQGGRTVCAIPLGIDTPSSIGIIVCVLGPVYAKLAAQGVDPMEAGIHTWHVGLATMLLIGVFKLGMSFCGGWIQRNVPESALLGSLAGIGVALIGFMQLASLFTVPVAGMVSLAIVFFTLIARMRLPGGFPGVLAAVLLGSVLYHLMGAMHLSPGAYTAPPMEFYFHLPKLSFGGVHKLAEAFQHITVSLPFAILTVIGGINVNASAHAEGDKYKTRSVLLTEAIATLVAGFFGGVAQTTPYAGFPAYKRMGARAGYTLMVGLFIGLGGMLGYVSFIVELIPAPVLAPILLFLAVEVMSQPYLCCNKKYVAAISIAMLPSLARMMLIYLSDPSWMAPELMQKLMHDLSDTGFSSMLMVVVLANGFILIGMLWGGFVAEMTAHRFGKACSYLLICALLTFFGVIHSPDINGAMTLPWRETGIMRSVPYQLTAAYIITAICIYALGRISKPEDDSGVVEVIA